ncbi:MAG: hypothetical protein KI792_03525 [Alphaproteobacteria bacterium]|nr:hypothetical protein [Alphaproteobacteria bacterium SS10]
MTEPTDTNTKGGRGDGFARLIGEPLEVYTKINAELVEQEDGWLKSRSLYGFFFPLSWMVYWRLYQPALLAWLGLFAVYYLGYWFAPSGELFGIPFGIQMFEGEAPILLTTDILKISICGGVCIYGRAWLIRQVSSQAGIERPGGMLETALVTALTERRKSSLLGYIAVFFVALIELTTWIGAIMLVLAGINGPFEGISNS